MSSISSRRLSRSSLIFLPFLASSGLAPPPSCPSSSAQPYARTSWPPACGGRRRGLDRREDDPLLALVLPLPVRIGRLAGFIRFEEEDLRDPLVRVDLGGQRRRVADLERHVALPLGLEGRDVG